MKFFSMILVLAMATPTLASKQIVRRPSSPGSPGAARFYLNGNASFLRIEGEAAQVMFNSLKVKATSDIEGAGDTLFFKDGESYRCFGEAQDTSKPSADKLKNYNCDVFVSDPAKGKTGLR